MSKDHYCPSKDWDRYCRHEYNPPRQVNLSLYLEWLIESFKSGSEGIYSNWYRWFWLESEIYKIEDFWYNLNSFGQYSFKEYSEEE